MSPPNYRAGYATGCRLQAPLLSAMLTLAAHESGDT